MSQIMRTRFLTVGETSPEEEKEEVEINPVMLD